MVTGMGNGRKEVDAENKGQFMGKNPFGNFFRTPGRGDFFVRHFHGFL